MERTKENEEVEGKKKDEKNKKRSGMRTEMKLEGKEKSKMKEENGKMMVEKVEKERKKDVVVVGGSIIDFVIRAEEKKRLMVSKLSQFIHLCTTPSHPLFLHSSFFFRISFFFTFSLHSLFRFYFQELSYYFSTLPSLSLSFSQPSSRWKLLSFSLIAYCCQVEFK